MDGDSCKTYYSTMDFIVVSWLSPAITCSIQVLLRQWVMSTTIPLLSIVTVISLAWQRSIEDSVPINAPKVDGVNAPIVEASAGD
ncbi:hypothetical protein TIFTF001_024921 [Ficus carica]|uniref:Uncharacterized protein n=1 Tax=Ficus carica TaxID=3494 RepID=A0AA88AMV2_FICCA|nr:hypothetical protein TIFTF001_024921 [Ficus carica]